MKQRDITTPSLTYAPELMMKSSAVTLGPMYTGASALLFTVPLSNLEAPSIRQQSPMHTLRMVPVFIIYTPLPMCARLLFSADEYSLIIVRSRSVRSGRWRYMAIIYANWADRRL